MSYKKIIFMVRIVASAVSVMPFAARVVGLVIAIQPTTNFKWKCTE